MPAPWPEIHLTARPVRTRAALVRRLANGLYLVPVVLVGVVHSSEFWARIKQARDQLPSLEPVLRYEFNLPSLSDWDALTRFSICYQLQYGHALNDYDRLRPSLALP